VTGSSSDDDDDVDDGNHVDEARATAGSDAASHAGGARCAELELESGPPLPNAEAGVEPV
jgi:hypothetical protein